MNNQLIAMMIPQNIGMWLGNKRKNPSIMWFISKFFYKNSVMNDRFGIFNEESDYELHTSYKSIDIEETKNYKPISLEESCYTRTNEIIDLARKLDKDIYVSWSGGVDSTCIVSSFMMNDRLDRKRFHVLHTNESIKEYPQFIHFLEKENINLVKASSYTILGLDEKPKENLVVNGSCGDKIYVNDLTYEYIKKLATNFSSKKITNINDIVKIICKHLKYTNNEYYIEKFKQYINKFDIQIETFNDFMWLIHYGFWWTRTAEFRSLFSEYPHERIPFFDTKEFSIYGYQRFVNKKDYDGYYKTDMKKIIFSLTKDENYFLNKGKDYVDLRHNTTGIYCNIKTTKYGYKRIKINNESNLYNFYKPFIKEKYINDIFIQK